jgi:hypothetical protein
VDGEGALVHVGEQVTLQRCAEQDRGGQGGEGAGQDPAGPVERGLEDSVVPSREALEDAVEPLRHGAECGAQEGQRRGAPERDELPTQPERHARCSAHGRLGAGQTPRSSLFVDPRGFGFGSPDSREARCERRQQRERHEQRREQ